MTPAHIGMGIFVGAEVMITTGRFFGYYGLVFEYDGLIAMVQHRTEDGSGIATLFHKSRLMILSMNDIDRQLTLDNWQELQVVDHYRKSKK